jgi:hypothetical protein
MGAIYRRLPRGDRRQVVPTTSSETVTTPVHTARDTG